MLASCAEVRVTRTEVATGAHDPKAIYIRPFDVTYSTYECYQGGNGRAIRKSLAPIEFANDLQEELSKIAPARVLKANERAPIGWVVEGEFEVIDAGDVADRSIPVESHLGRGASHVKLHVRVIDVGDKSVVTNESKDGVEVTKEIHTKSGNVVYEFDLAGGSRGSGPFGSIYAPGLGNAIPFDFRNAAERIMLALSPDPFRYGYRSSPTRMF